MRCCREFEEAQDAQARKQRSVSVTLEAPMRRGDVRPRRREHLMRYAARHHARSSASDAVR